MHETPNGSGLIAPRRLSPAAIKQTEFPRVMRGYDVGTVEAFRDAVLAEVAAGAAENTALADEVAALAAEKTSLTRECNRLTHTPPREVPAPPDGERAARILVAAQRQREEVLGQAQAYARQIGEDGETRRRALLADAQVRGEAICRSLLEDATRQAADIIARAPGGAQEKLVKTRALADAVEAHLTAFLESLESSLDTFRAQLADRDAQPGRVEAGGYGTP